MTPDAGVLRRDIRRLAWQSFELQVAADAAGVPQARLAQWLKVGAFELMEGQSPGTGRRRLFHVVDIYSARLFGALTDARRGLGLPLGAARDVLTRALMLAPMDPYPPVNWVDPRFAYANGDFIGLDPCRGLDAPQWLVARRVHLVEPEQTVWRASFEDEPKVRVWEGDRTLARAFVALEATPHVLAVNHALFDRLGWSAERDRMPAPSREG